MLQLAHLVMTGSHRLVGRLHDRAAFARQFLTVEGCFEFRLEIVLAALDLVYDRLLVATCNCGLEILEALVRLAHERTIVLRIAAKTPDLTAQVLYDLLALIGSLPEDFSEAFVIDVLGAIFVAGDAVDRSCDQRVEGTDRG